MLDASRMHVFSDFDGTITQTDTLRFLTERFGGGVEYFRETERLIAAGSLTLRDAVVRDMHSIRASFGEAADALTTELRIDPGFPAFARWCATRAIPLTVLSAGFEELVRLFLPHEEFPGIDVFANRFEPGTWRCVFRDDTEFGHDKAAVLRAVERRGHHAVFVGDGVSDHDPARVASVVFARRRLSLAAYCRQHGIPFHEYEGFDDVRAILAARLETGA